MVAGMVDGLARMVDRALVVGGMLLAVVVFYNVFSRYVLATDLAASNELAIFLLVWTAFLGAASAVRRGTHLQVNEILAALPSRPQRICRIGIQFAVIVVLLFMLVYGSSVAWTNRDQLTTVLYWPVGLLYAACPAGALLMLVFACEQTIRMLAEPASATD